MVREYPAFVAVQVVPELLDSPNHTQCLYLCHTVVALMCLQGSASPTHHLAFWARTAPSPFPEVSVSSWKFLEKSGNTRSRASVNRLFNASKHSESNFHKLRLHLDLDYGRLYIIINFFLLPFYGLHSFQNLSTHCTQCYNKETLIHKPKLSEKQRKRQF